QSTGVEPITGKTQPPIQPVSQTIFFIHLQ
ncbi:hypothetical protein Godav_012706, partial [Gossypium davidsonii]|nr:hypothetical protein [Gossypium davidsonii]MBA0647183.1 hypothetical protein [Gossypium klotzschianum]